MPRIVRHIPVLLQQVLDALRPQPGDIIVDCTAGLGGHSAELLKRVSPGGQIIAIDFDPANLRIAQENLAVISGNFSLHHTNFAALPTVLAAEGIKAIDGILADLGVASPHIDDPARGFSYRAEGPLDMRMDPTRGQPASSIINRLPERELAQLLFDFGDEEDASVIARLIAERRADRPIETTSDLTAIVCQARNFTLKRAAGAKLHPAARTFQALRMLVNREPANLERLLMVIPDFLKSGRTAAIISFHSGEDRRVKAAFRNGIRSEIYAEISSDPITATADEQKQNPRSRSAKLRWARKA